MSFSTAATFPVSGGSCAASGAVAVVGVRACRGLERFELREDADVAAGFVVSDVQEYSTADTCAFWSYWLLLRLAVCHFFILFVFFAIF